MPNAIRSALAALASQQSEIARVVSVGVVPEGAAPFAVQEVN